MPTGLPQDIYELLFIQSFSSYTAAQPTCIMRPGGEGPGGVADEIGAVVRDAEVVDHLPRAGVVYLTEGDTVTQQREQPIPGLETARGCPAFACDIEGVFRGGADQFAMRPSGDPSRVSLIPVTSFRLIPATSSFPFSFILSLTHWE